MLHMQRCDAAAAEDASACMRPLVQVLSLLPGTGSRAAHYSGSLVHSQCVLHVQGGGAAECSVLHASGVLADSLVAKQTLSGICTVFASKVRLHVTAHALCLNGKFLQMRGS